VQQDSIKMKWLKRILDKHEIPTTVTFDGIDAWLEIASKTLFRGLSTSAEPLYKEIKDIRERLEHRKIAKEKENVSAREKECSALEREIEKEGKRLSAIEDQEEWMRFKTLETELFSLERELSTLESDVSKLFSPINKELNLLKKQDEAGRHTLTPDERKAVSSILSSPIRALDEDINVFLCSIKDVIEGDSSILKERKRDKTLKWIDRLLNGELAAINEKREGLQSQIVQVKGELLEMTIHKERKKVEQSIASAMGQLTRLREGVERSKRHVVSLEEELEAKTRRLPDTLEAIAGKPIEVNLDV